MPDAIFIKIPTTPTFQKRSSKHYGPEVKVGMKKRDILIIAAVLVLAVGLYGVSQLVMRQGPEDSVNIYIGNQLYERHSLREDTVVEVKQGDLVNHIEIKDGVVRMLDANCGNQDCVHMGSMSAKDQGLMFGVIVCLPHQVTVELRLAEEER